MCLCCKAGWHAECSNIIDSACCCWRQDMQLGTVVSPDTLGRNIKEDGAIQDVLSTGRKRAAAMFPIPSIDAGGMQCEWAWLAFAGGGVAPIIGCRGNMIADIKERTEEFWPGNAHHGPNKSVLKNVPGNVHRVCPQCHNRWHALNDPYYSKSRPDAGADYLPLSGEMLEHDAETKANGPELDWSDEFWKASNKQRQKLLYRVPGMRD